MVVEGIREIHLPIEKMLKPNFEISFIGEGKTVGLDYYYNHEMKNDKNGKPQSLCVFNETCGRAMAIEHNGDLYSCDYYVYPENKLGNILETALASMVDSPQELQFGMDKKEKLPNYCLQCDVRFACNGECPKHRFIKTPDGEDGLNYLCAGYKTFFHHVDPYMKFMANELYYQRSPAAVMDWTHEKDNGFPNFNTGRNDDCPCGSGKKFKNCCMK